MDVLQALLVLRKKKLFLLFGALFGASLAVLFLILYPHPRFRVTTLLFVTRPEQKESSDYFAYEGIHAQQVSFHYTDTLIGLAREAEADIVKRRGEQLVLVGVEGKNVADADLDELVASLSDTFSRVAQAGNVPVKVVELKEFRRRESADPFLPLIIGAGLFAGLSCGVAVTVGAEYLKRCS